MKSGSPVMTSAASHQANAPVASRRREIGGAGERESGGAGGWESGGAGGREIGRSGELGKGRIRRSTNTHKPHNSPIKKPSGRARIIDEATIIPVLVHPR